MVTASQLVPTQKEESVDQRRQSLRQELAEAELQWMMVAYNDHIDVKTVTATDVKAVAGSVGPLYCADVQVAGIPGKHL